MEVQYNQGLLMCREYLDCEFIKCKHYTWHEERSSCKPRTCNKTGLDVSCTATPKS